MIKLSIQDIYFFRLNVYNPKYFGLFDIFIDGNLFTTKTNIKVKNFHVSYSSIIFLIDNVQFI